MQAVGEVRRPVGDAMPLQACHQGSLFVNSDMPLIGIEVFIREQPADLFREKPGDTDHQVVPGFQHADNLPHGSAISGDMFQDFRTDDQVKGIRFKRQVANIGRGKGPTAAAVGTQAVVKSQAFAGLGHVAIVQVRADRQGLVQLIRRRRVTAATADNIENFKTGPDSEAPKIDRDHG